MKTSFSILIALLPFFSAGQNIDIYSKWTATIEDNVQLILDLSNGYYIGVTRIKAIDNIHHRIDSFGYKRKFNSTFVDLDSSMIWWSGSMQPLHQKLDTDLRLGTIEIVNKNYRGVPEQIKFSGDLPDLSLYLNDEDTILFSRMVFRDKDETEYRYKTVYGGDITNIVYTGEYGGFSSGIQDPGMAFRSIRLSKSLTKDLSSLAQTKVNALRRSLDIDSLVHDITLDTGCIIQMNSWVKAAQMQHRLNISPQFEEGSNSDSSASRNSNSKFGFLHYPFLCGLNATAIQLNGMDLSSDSKIRKYINGHYYLIFSQSFSIYENQ